MSSTQGRQTRASKEPGRFSEVRRETSRLAAQPLQEFTVLPHRAADSESAFCRDKQDHFGRVVGAPAASADRPNGSNSTAASAVSTINATVVPSAATTGM